MNQNSWFRSSVEKTAGWIFDTLYKEYRVEGMRFSVPFDQTDREFRSRFVLGYYELPERNLIAKYLDPNASVLEMGACLGVVSCITNKKLTDPKNHVAVEPNTSMVEHLTHNRDRNERDFTIINGVVAEGDFVEFHISGNNPVSNRLGRETGTVAKVKCYSVAELQDRVQQPFTCAVMDIEGAEFQFVESYAEELKGFNQIFLELHPQFIGAEKVERIRGRFKELGFVLEATDQNCEYWSKTKV